MSEDGDYSPAHWAGHDFSSARAHYDAYAGRSYAAATTAGKTVTDLVEPELHTDSPAPLIIAVDVTGSMGEWPVTIFSKLPYLELEGQTYLGKEMEIAWLAVGDAHSDKYALQARPFTKGTDLKKRLEELVIEGGGGGGGTESYELSAFYLLHKAHMPKAKNPIFIFIGDEMPYPTISPAHAKIAGVTLQEQVITDDIFRALKNKMAVYMIRKPYGSYDEQNERRWTELVGADHMALLDDPARVVDVIFGILAKETGKVDEFKSEIEDRQTKDQVNTVYKSLKTIHQLSGAAPKALPAHGKSVIHNPTKHKKPKDLL